MPLIHRHPHHNEADAIELQELDIGTNKGHVATRTRDWHAHSSLGFTEGADDESSEEKSSDSIVDIDGFVVVNNPQTLSSAPTSSLSLSRAALSASKWKHRLTLSRSLPVSLLDARMSRVNSEYWDAILRRSQDATLLPLREIMASKHIVRCGVPPRLRPLVWSSACSIHMLIDENPTQFKQLLAKKVDSSKAIEQIEKDLQRTFPEHPFYRTEEGTSSLRRCLAAFAARNPHIGYSQSMNFVAGTLNLIFQEEAAFWMLVCIVERILPRDYYDESLLGCRVELAVLKLMIRKKLPRVHAVLKLHQVDIVVVCVSWFLCLFVNTLPIETVLRVWDSFFVEGQKVLFRVALALFKLRANDLIKCADINEIMAVLTNMGKDVDDADLLMKTAFKRLGVIRRTMLSRYRQLCRQKLEQSDREVKARREKAKRD